MKEEQKNRQFAEDTKDVWINWKDSFCTRQRFIVMIEFRESEIKKYLLFV